jgi:polysaccharide chain length determinant protein (PEP-CTERM system associated)
MEERSVHPLDYLSVLRRRKWWFIVPLVLCLLAGGALALWLPRTYYSQAEIGVAAASLSPDLLRGVQSLDPGERQRAISQQLLSPTVLERVVREEGINRRGEPQEVAAWLRGQIEIGVSRPIGRPNDRGGFDSFTLGYTATDPLRAQQVTNRLAQVFVEENSRTRVNRAENTSEVLAQQLKGSQERLAELEDQLYRKKEANMGRLPDQMSANIQMVNGLRSQAESLATQIRGEQDRLSFVESQIAAMEQGTGGTALTTSGTAALTTAQGRLHNLQQQLAAARIKYHDTHPEIRILQDEIERAREDLKAARADGTGSARELLLADAAYQQRINDRNQLRARIRSLQQAESSTRARISQFENAVAAAPRVEQDLGAVQRDVDFERARVADLKAKYDAAVIAEDLSRKEGGEHFMVLYGATLPTAPRTPDIPRILLMSLALGFVLGAGGVIGREFVDRSVHDAAALQTEFDVPVLGEIPRIHGAV